MIQAFNSVLDESAKRTTRDAFGVSRGPLKRRVGNFFPLLLGCLILVVSFSAVAQESSGQKFNAQTIGGKRTLILGDSITQNGTWVSLLEYFLRKSNLSEKFDLISAGLGSENVSGVSEPGHAGGAFPRPCLHDRLERVLQAVQPQVVIACYGMNDGGYLPFTQATLEAFQQGITRLVSESRHAGAQVVLVTPPVFDIRKVKGPNNDPDYDGTLGKFATWLVKSPPIGTLAVIDLHTSMSRAFAERRKANPEFFFAADGVHPSELGHLVMAKAVLDAMRVALPPGTLEEVLASTQTDPVFKLVDQRRKVLSNAWLTHIGYTRERTVPPGTGDLPKAIALAAALEEQIHAAPAALR